ncbi:hypothetical protein WDW89_21595 [Deltaproteobacteria bacterium TL4]
MKLIFKSLLTLLILPSFLVLPAAIPVNEIMFVVPPLGGKPCRKAA